MLPSAIDLHYKDIVTGKQTRSLMSDALLNMSRSAGISHLGEKQSFISVQIATLIYII